MHMSVYNVAVKIVIAHNLDDFSSLSSDAILSSKRLSSIAVIKMSFTLVSKKKKHDENGKLLLLSHCNLRDVSWRFLSEKNDHEKCAIT